MRTLIPVLLSVIIIIFNISCGGTGASTQTTSAISVSIMPSSVSIGSSQSQQFTATVSGTTNTAVSWTVDGVGGGNATTGTITSRGLYTAPVSAGSHAVAAISVADLTKAGNATITVTGPRLTALEINPQNTVVTIGGSQQYSATGHFSNSSTQDLTSSVTWSSSAASVAGISAIGAASAILPGATIIEASFGKLHASTSLTVTSMNSSVHVSPRVAPVSLKGNQQFTADEVVTWYVDGLLGGSSTAGTITSSGVYTPPAIPGTHRIMALSQNNPSQNGTAQVTVTDFEGMFTYHYDNMRQGANTRETVLTHANVNPAQFGKLFSLKVDGWVHAQPLYGADVQVDGAFHNVVYVATEHDSVYAFDADGRQGSPLWQTSFISPSSGITTVPTGDLGAADVAQLEFGITSTPVIDRDSGTLYLVARTKENGSYFIRLHALDISTGAEKFGGPVTLQGSVPGNGVGNDGAGHVPFNPLRENVRPALLLDHGIVYITAASVDDVGPYHGWVFAYNAQNLSQVGVWNTTPKGNDGGMWNSGGGPAADAAGFVYILTGNGTFDPANGDYGQAFVKLSLGSSGFNVEDFFTPSNVNTLNINDWDLSSGAIMLLPDQLSTHPHSMLAGGKQGVLYLVDRDNLGKFNSSRDEVLQELTEAIARSENCCDKGLWSTPTYWNDKVYLCGRVDVVKVFALNGGLLSSSPIETGTVNMRGPTLTISSNGSNDGILWAVQFDAQSTGGRAILHAWDADDITRELYNSTWAGSRDLAGTAVKFAVPTVANGRVYVAAQTEIDVYGLF